MESTSSVLTLICFDTVVKQQLFHNKDLNMGILSIQPKVSELSKQGEIVRKFL